ncbi:MAG: hypothetical protein V4683_08440 [Bacteroidota bacterium]
MTNLILAFALFFTNPDFKNKDFENSKIEREVKVLEAKLAKILNTKALTPCEQACLDKLRIATNICNHLAPINRQACLNNAYAKYNACRAACN